MIRVTNYLAAILATAGLAGCHAPEEGTEPNATEPAEPVMATVEGNVTYRERMMLPPGAEIEVQLQDISLADAPAEVLAKVRLTPEGGPPYPFAIEYDKGRVEAQGWYALHATISVGDELLFTTADYIDPFGSNAVNIILQRVPERVEE